MLFGKRKRVVNRILIVEDEPLTAFDNEMMLGDLGYEVVATLDSFEDAIERLDRDEVDLVLSDYRLSGERTGIDLARAAKNRKVPIIFATGHQLPPESVELAVGCITKPYTERTLKLTLTAVDKHLSGQRAKPPKGVELFVLQQGGEAGVEGGDAVLQRPDGDASNQA
ncbi:MAG TPA: response regulator [Sphingomicrobium sp.]